MSEPLSGLDKQVMSGGTVVTPIGVIRTPFTTPEGMPIQPSGGSGIRGRIEIFPPYQEGLADLDGFERIILIYLFHQTRGWNAMVTPYLDVIPHGVFATRAPRRPNSIGFSVVRLEWVKENILEISDIDILDYTPLLDIKPYVPKFDGFLTSRAGWMEKVQTLVEQSRSDDRFHQ